MRANVTGNTCLIFFFSELHYAYNCYIQQPDLTDRLHLLLVVCLLHFLLQISTPALDGAVLGSPKSHVIPFLVYTAIPSPLHIATYHYVKLSLTCRALKKHHTAKDLDALLLFLSYKTQCKTHWITQGALTFLPLTPYIQVAYFFPDAAE